MQFTYRAKQDSRSEASGVIEAVDLQGAIAHLKEMRLYPLEVVPLEEKNPSRLSVQPRPLSRSALSLWARTIGQGLQAGLSLTQALHLLAEQEQGRPTGQITRILEERVTAGVGLGEAMEGFGGCFPPVAVSLVKSGEASGGLEQVLQALAQQVETEGELIAKVWGALVYPLFVLTIGVGTVAVLMWVVVPKLALLFAETGQPLPGLTRLMVASGRGLFWAAGCGFLVLLAGFVGTRQGWFNIPWIQWGMKILGRLPWFGRLIAHAEIARLSSNLGLLLGHGLPLPQALQLGAATVSRPYLKAQVQQSHHLVVEGLSLSAGLRRVGLKEPFLLTMIAMGEAQGDLSAAFEKAGVRYHQEVDREVKILGTLIEPVMILLVGLVVGGIVFSMLLPIFQLNFTVGQ
ncbi:MAG: type II secretion system F family protein [Candidatus Omnitrophica bacterium]|nr:type II secretion system F family protein [Candidatus Omnitrophota bacterium]